MKNVFRVINKYSDNYFACDNETVRNAWIE